MRNSPKGFDNFHVIELSSKMYFFKTRVFQRNTKFGTHYHHGEFCIYLSLNVKMTNNLVGSPANGVLSTHFYKKLGPQAGFDTTTVFLAFPASPTMY